MPTALSGFHIGDRTDVEPAHFWSQGPLVNGVRSWQLIIKHDLTHQFHIRTLCVHLSFPVPYRSGHRCGTGSLLETWSTCKWCQKLASEHDLTHQFHIRTLGVRPTVSGFHIGEGTDVKLTQFWSQGVRSCEWCQKLATDYKT